MPRPLALAAAAVLAVPAAAFAQAFTMGPTWIGGASSPDVANSINQLTSVADPSGGYSQTQLTDNLLTSSPAVQIYAKTFVGGSWARARATCNAAYTTGANTSTIAGSIEDMGQIISAGNDTVTAYAGASLFFHFTTTTPVNYSLQWSTSIAGTLPASTVMFWNIARINPTYLGINSSSNVDTGLDTGTFLTPGEYELLITRHDGLTGTGAHGMFSTLTFDFTATKVPAPGAAATFLAGLLTLARRRRERPEA